MIELATKLSNEHLSGSWIDSFLKRNRKFLWVQEASPIDDLRANIKIEEYICALINCSENDDPSLFVNIDETGYTDVSSSQLYSAIIPKEFEGKTCHFKINRNQKNVTTIASITLDGDMQIPGIVIPLESIPIELDSSGFRDGKDALVLTSDAGYVTNDIFFTYFYKVIVPYIRKTRMEKKLYESPALIHMDNCYAHVSENIHLICAEENIRLVTYPPHTSHLFQPLDLLIFGLFKRKNGVYEWYKSFNTIIQRIVLMMNGIRSVCTPDNIRSSFRRAGIFINYSVFPYQVEIKLDLVRRNIEGKVSDDSKCFSELKRTQTRKRRKTLFGYVNALEGYLISKSICPHCFENIHDDDGYIDDESSE